MSKKELDPLDRLRAVDQAFARRGVSDETRDAVRRRLQQRVIERSFRTRLRWWPVLAFAAGVILMGVLLLPRDRVTVPGDAPVVAVPTGDPLPSPAQALVAVDTVQSDRSPCITVVPGPIGLEPDACAIRDGVRMNAVLPSQLVWSAESVDLQRGEVSFDVEPRSQRPLHVTFGKVDIEVVGTRFVVHYDGTRGWVSVHEGHVRVRDGTSVQDLHAGERVQWPEAAEALEVVAPAPRRRPNPAARDDGLATLLQEVSALRRRGAYAEAVERLESADSAEWSRRARQLISYEVGTLLQRQLGDSARACAHWKKHRRRYPNAGRDAVIVRSMGQLRCAEPAG
ncbi:MAG: FecR family protein [Nannocystaceae bacterium]|nr:FecR family protein [Nannocystaceae bacterium]